MLILSRVVIMVGMGILALMGNACAQATPGGPPTPAELVRALETGPDIGASGDYLMFKTCPSAGSLEAQFLAAIEGAQLPPESLIALAVAWRPVLDTCPGVVAWYETALDDIIASGDGRALRSFLLRPPRDLTDRMRESLLDATANRAFHQDVLENVLRRAIHHSDLSRQMQYALRAFERVSMDGAGVREVMFGESDFLYRSLGPTYVRALVAAAPRFTDPSLRVAAEPVARSLSQAGRAENPQLARDLSGALSGREGMERLLELLRDAGE